MPSLTATATAGTGEGTLALVLHTHMPYVEGYGTWPFGEEWLWEAAATSWLPLLDVLDDRVTLSVTPVLADQLAAPGAAERLRAFLLDLRARTHALDLEAAAGGAAPGARGQRGRLRRAPRSASTRSAATSAGRSWRAPRGRARPRTRCCRCARRRRRPAAAADGDRGPPRARRGAVARRPLAARVRARAVAGPAARGGRRPRHLRRPHRRPGRGRPGHLRPRRTPAGPLLVPVDRSVVELVWSEGGYPAHAAYRDYHALTERHHRAWANDGAPYDADRAAGQVAADAADFVARVAARLRGGGLCVCALDTELLGHWWFEGPAWLRAVLAEADRAGLAVQSLDDAVAAAAPADLPPGAERVTTWGTPRTLWTWSGPQVADLAFGVRDAELRVVAAGAAAGDRALRELLALQASDWAFLATRGTAGPYPRERAAGHRAALDRALAGDDGDGRVRALAPHLRQAALLAP